MCIPDHVHQNLPIALKVKELLELWTTLFVSYEQLNLSFTQNYEPLKDLITLCENANKKLLEKSMNTKGRLGVTLDQHIKAYEVEHQNMIELKKQVER